MRWRATWGKARERVPLAGHFVPCANQDRQMASELATEAVARGGRPCQRSRPGCSHGCLLAQHTDSVPVSPEEFLNALREAVPRWGGAEWIADRVDGDDIVVLYRQRLRARDEPEGLVEGARMNFADFSAVILGPGDHPLHSVLGEAALEIVEPHGLGRVLPVDWANGLTEHPEEVRWYGDALSFPTADPVPDATKH
jgi:hypothetical protein